MVGPSKGRRRNKQERKKKGKQKEKKKREKKRKEGRREGGKEGKKEGRREGRKAGRLLILTITMSYKLTIYILYFIARRRLHQSVYSIFRIHTCSCSTFTFWQLPLVPQYHVDLNRSEMLKDRSHSGCACCILGQYSGTPGSTIRKYNETQRTGLEESTRNRKPRALDSRLTSAIVPQEEDVQKLPGLVLQVFPLGIKEYGLTLSKAQELYFVPNFHLLMFLSLIHI